MIRTNQVVYFNFNNLLCIYSLTTFICVQIKKSYSSALSFLLWFINTCYLTLLFRKFWVYEWGYWLVVHFVSLIITYSNTVNSSSFWCKNHFKIISVGHPSYLGLPVTKITVVAYIYEVVSRAIVKMVPENVVVVVGFLFWELKGNL